jgi:hypothetical protein
MNNKNVFLLGILLLASMANHAQAPSMAAPESAGSSKFYIKAYGGYGFIQPGSYKLYSVSIVPTGDITGNVAESKQGLGSGIRFGGGVGVIASDFLNIGVDVEYLSGTTLTSNSSYNSTSGYNTFINTSISYTSLSIIPHVIFKALSKPDYLIYNKLGLLLNLPMEMNRSEHDTSYTVASPDQDYNAHINGTYKFNLTVGLNVALGVQYRLTDNLRAYGEIFGNFIVLVPDTYDVTNVASVGKNPPGTDISHITYIRSGQTFYTTVGNTHTSTTSVEGSSFNMNAIGINIGVAFRF